MIKSNCLSFSLSLCLVQNFHFGFARRINYLRIRLICFHWRLFMHVWRQFNVYCFGSLCSSLSNIPRKSSNCLVVKMSLFTCSSFHVPFSWLIRPLWMKKKNIKSSSITFYNKNQTFIRIINAEYYYRFLSMNNIFLSIFLLYHKMANHKPINMDSFLHFWKSAHLPRNHNSAFHSIYVQFLFHFRYELQRI